ncbi:hypothetical protein ERJ75_000962700 [Trypanosoma vivax]|nr:hypothetical protein TRVL_03172 [Trypanosoma vivax]KAH8611925.1 hypothetical protein ERJ75_000962700 [Trypanosoma vivax]
MSRRDVNQEIAIARHLQEYDDSILCAFGPDFFDGARKGAGFGGIFTAWLAWRSFVDLKNDHRECDALLPGQRIPNQWTIPRGFRSRPFFTLGCVSLGITTVMKAAKFYLANYRYQEFVADDVGFALLQSLYGSMSGSEPQFKDFLNEVLTKPSHGSSALNKEALVDEQRKSPRVVTDFLLRNATHVCEREPPSFWDGVAVGLVGSIMDCYLPAKPIQTYYGMRCGVSL